MTGTYSLRNPATASWLLDAWASYGMTDAGVAAWLVKGAFVVVDLVVAPDNTPPRPGAIRLGTDHDQIVAQIFDLTGTNLQTFTTRKGHP